MYIGRRLSYPECLTKLEHGMYGCYVGLRLVLGLLDRHASARDGGLLINVCFWQ